MRNHELLSSKNRENPQIFIEESPIHSAKRGTRLRPSVTLAHLRVVPGAELELEAQARGLRGVLHLRLELLHELAPRLADRCV